MEQFTLGMLEYESIKEEMASYAVSYEGRLRIQKLVPMERRAQIEQAIEETAEAKELLLTGASVPLPSLEGIDTVMSLLGTGYLFTEKDFTAIQTFLYSCGQLKKYMASKGALAPRIGLYAASLYELAQLQQEILRCIRHGAILDGASRDLDRIRRRMGMLKEKVQKKLQAVMSRHASILQENLVSMRGGRYVIPVKKDYYKQVKGRTLDQSTSGQTVFVEPDEVASLQAELEVLAGDEAREEAKILGYLTELVEREAHELSQNIEITGTYDFIFAKAKYAVAIGGTAVRISENGASRITGARHPHLLKTMVPLDLEIGSAYRTLIITGPNTGGKTVVLKTFGLLALMVQSGLLVPVGTNSSFAIYSRIMAVIGDGQNLEQSLSTFSAQIRSLVHMIQEAGPDALLLIDELAAGTDPGEGIALSMAILEELSRRGATVLVTTHFNELKTFASHTEGFQNARMEFDPETLMPLYRLTIGQAGQSYAIEIASNLGIYSGVIERAREMAAQQEGAASAGGLLDGQEYWPCNKNTKKESEAETEHHEDGYTNSEAEEDRQETNAGYTEENCSAIGKSSSDEAAAEKPQRSVFEVGDAVWVTAYGKIGIVFAAEDSRGQVGVMIQKQKCKVNRKRLKPYIKKEELYPEDYDMDIVFETKENRKKSKLMRKRHVEGLEIVRRPEDD
ncbi:endonuclease MutS2 [Paenibacillus woosongensis]|uniref:endonuclease MutS2 n=1 Tax=Paenibacillus woosongensis TaxID=307580 RepID=UPI003D317F86